MKTFIVLAVLVAATQASEFQRISRAFPGIEGAPKYPASRIIKGIQAEHGQFPHQASVSSAGGFCGGSLISPRWVLTAAHCAYGQSSFSVYLGAQSINAASEDGRVVVQSNKKIVHSGFFPLIAPNDIALIDLQQDVPLSKYIQPVALASGNDLFEGAVARVSGWGKVSDASNSVSPQLNYVDLNIISNAECQQVFGTINVRASTICALGAGGRSTCNGDSGGPLLDLASGKQIGIVSFGHVDGCESGNPNAFARVSAYASWISENTGLSL